MSNTRIQDTANPHHRRDILASITAKQRAQGVRVDHDGHPVAPPKPRRYDQFGNLLGLTEQQDN
ncbi:hypothetical protein [Nocardia sp. NPDC050175]|uniref:hypothetical protein n=1 Tax=Nocardia sp. NPDC050175 TaxID=3364317 RepID=UPI0037A89EB7